MSIKGQSFTGSFSDGAHIDFDVGTAGADTVFASDYTIAVLAKTTNSAWGLLGAYTDTTAGTPIRQFFLSNNSGGRFYGDSDFTAGFPDPADDADGVNDGTWRWHVMSKATGSAHYKYSYADLSTLTWIDGESASSANHSDNATAAGMFSTWAVYAMGFDTGDMAAICVWPTQLDTTQIHASCTQAAAALVGTSTPIVGWLFPQATSGSTILDFTGGGADEISRPLIATSTDPPSFNFALPSTVALTPATMAIAPVAITPVPGVVSVSLVNASVVVAPKSFTPVPGVVSVVLAPAPMLITTTSIGNVPVSTSFSVVYNTDIPVSGSFSILYDVATRVPKSVSLVYDTHSILSPGKVFSLVFDVRKVVSKSCATEYEVMVPVSPDKTFALSHGVLLSVSKSVSIDYDTGIVGSTAVSKSFDIRYHTLVTSAVDKIITVPISVDSIPPQIVTTSF